MSERHELEDINREAQDYAQTLRWNAFLPDAVAQAKECLEKDGDLMDLINDFDMHYDESVNLTNKEVNEIVVKAVVNMLAEKDRK
jgi:hypothetical protein